MTRLAFLDTETTGLDPDLHEVWEVGVIVREDDGTETEEHWFLPVDLGRADAVALRIGGFHDRYDRELVERLDLFARDFAKLTRGCHLVGAVISFDEERLRRLLRSNGACPEWHYHLIDIEALVAGQFGVQPPWKSDELGAMVGTLVSDEDRHTAIGDARWAKAVYDAVMAPPTVNP